MTEARPAIRRADAPGRSPQRTCVGCRRVGAQGSLLRLARTAAGDVRADPDRRAGGRGAYLCRDERCLDAAVRRARWGQLFRGPAVLTSETVERVRVLLRAGREGDPAGVGVGVGSHGESGDGRRPTGRLGVSLGGSR